VLTILISSIHLGLCVLWIGRFGMYGAGWAALVVSVIQLIVNGSFALWCEAGYRRARRVACER